MRATHWTAVAGTALLCVGLWAGGVFAHIARTPSRTEDPQEQKFAPLIERACPSSIELGASGWKGLLASKPHDDVKSLCGRSGHWTYFRARPQSEGVEIEWESAGPVQVAIGWGSCHDAPSFCPQTQRQPIADWPPGAPLWIAVLDPSVTDEGPDDSDDAKDSETEESTEPEPGLRFQVRWRSVDEGSPLHRSRQ